MHFLLILTTLAATLTDTLVTANPVESSLTKKATHQLTCGTTSNAVYVRLESFPKISGLTSSIFALSVPPTAPVCSLLIGRTLIGIGLALGESA
jgi:hypothetical protein